MIIYLFLHWTNISWLCLYTGCIIDKQNRIFEDLPISYEKQFKRALQFIVLICVEGISTYGNTRRGTFPALWVKIQTSGEDVGLN